MKNQFLIFKIILKIYQVIFNLWDILKFIFRQLRTEIMVAEKIMYNALFAL